MLKRVIILLIVLASLWGCAKKSTEFKADHILNLSRTIPLVGYPVDFYMADSLLYVAEDQAGISIINLNTFAKKWFTNFYDVTGSALQMIKIRKVSVIPSLNRLFANETDGTDQIKIVDISVPDSMKVQDSITGATQDIQEMTFSPITTAGNLFTYEGYFCSGPYVKYGRYGFHNPDIPAYWSITQTYNIPATANGFFVKDQYLYVAADQRGLIIYNKANGTIAGQLDLPGEAQKVKVVGDYAYVACRQDGLQIINISNPAAPVKVSSYDTSGYATNLDAWANYVVVSSGGGGIYVFDVTNPANPVLKDNITSCGYVNTVEYYQNKIYVAARDQGVLIYTIED